MSSKSSLKFPGLVVGRSSPYGLRRRGQFSSPSAETIFIDSGSESGDGEKAWFVLEYPPKESPSLKDIPNALPPVRMDGFDISCLMGEGFLNDAVIDFWLQYVIHEYVHRTDKKKILSLSALSYISLHALYKNPRLSTKYEGLRWTKNVEDLFLRQDFIFVPVAQDEHWLLAVICFPWMVFHEKNRQKLMSNPGPSTSEFLESYREKYWARFEKTRKFKAPRPMILIFDSFSSYGVDHKEIAGVLRNFLQIEWNLRYPSAKVSFTESSFPLQSPRVQQQTNYFDCGIYLLQFFQSFFDTPFSSYSLPLPNLLSWFSMSEVDEKRDEILQTIYTLVEKYSPANLPILFKHLPGFKPRREKNKKRSLSTSSSSGISSSSTSQNKAVSSDDQNSSSTTNSQKENDEPNQNTKKKRPSSGYLSDSDSDGAYVPLVTPPKRKKRKKRMTCRLISPSPLSPPPSSALQDVTASPPSFNKRETEASLPPLKPCYTVEVQKKPRIRHSLQSTSTSATLGSGRQRSAPSVSSSARTRPLRKNNAPEEMLTQRLFFYPELEDSD